MRREPHGQGEAADDESDWVVAAYRADARYLWALLGRLGVPQHSIEDVVQEVFLVLHRKRAEFRGASSVRTWLHGIAVHTARRYRAKMDRRTHEPIVDRDVVSDPPLEDELGARQALRQLDRVLASLPDDQREVFVLIEVAELAAPEVAELLGVKLNTVYSRLRLARARVERSLHEEAHDER